MNPLFPLLGFVGLAWLSSKGTTTPYRTVQVEGREYVVARVTSSGIFQVSRVIGGKIVSSLFIKYGEKPYKLESSSYDDQTIKDIDRFPADLMR